MIPARGRFPRDPITARVRRQLPAVYLLTCVKRFAATGHLTDLITEVQHHQHHHPLFNIPPEIKLAKSMCPLRLHIQEKIWFWAPSKLQDE